jgi:hypothetical protein
MALKEVKKSERRDSFPYLPELDFFPLCDSLCPLCFEPTVVHSNQPFDTRRNLAGSSVALILALR